MVGEASQFLDVLVGNVAAALQVDQIILDLQQFRPSHRQVSPELTAAKPSKPLSDEARCSPGGRSQLIAEFEIRRDPWYVTNCQYALTKLRGKLPGVELLERLRTHAVRPSTSRASTPALQHIST